jgi:hypothetical protein
LTVTPHFTQRCRLALNLAGASFPRSTFLHEPQLIGVAYDLEQEINVRQQPQFLGSVIPILNADLCTGHQNGGRPHVPHGRIF